MLIYPVKLVSIILELIDVRGWHASKDKIIITIFSHAKWHNFRFLSI